MSYQPAIAPHNLGGAFLVRFVLPTAEQVNIGADVKYPMMCEESVALNMTSKSFLRSIYPIVQLNIDFSPSKPIFWVRTLVGIRDKTLSFKGIQSCPSNFGWYNVCFKLEYHNRLVVDTLAVMTVL
jgi:hypothetical protein